MAAISHFKIDFQIDLQNRTIHQQDLPPEKAFKNLQKPKKIFNANLPAKFIECRFKEITAKEGLSLDSCTVDKVVALGNIILKDVRVKEVRSLQGSVLVLDRCQIGAIHAKEVYLLEAPTARIHGKQVLLSTMFGKTEDLELIEMVFKEEIQGNINAGINILSVTLDGCICRGDVIFSEKSLVPEERLVILKNGAKLLGKVVRGQLIEQAD